MGQKTAPISTRLYGNCWPDSCWYSDANRFSLFYQDFNQKKFFDAVMSPSGRKFGFRPAKIVSHQFPKRSSIHIFFLRRSRRFKLRGNRRRRIFRFAKHLNKKANRFKFKGFRMPVNKRLSAIDVLAVQHLYTNKNMLWVKAATLNNSIKQLRKIRPFLSLALDSKQSAQFTSTSSNLASNQTRRFKTRTQEKIADPKLSPFSGFKYSQRLIKNIGSTHSERQKEEIAVATSNLRLSPLFKCNSRVGTTSPTKRPYNIHMNELIRFTTGSNALIIPLSVSSMMVSASLLATHIRALLQQNKRFKSVCKWLFKDIKRYEVIKGVRISCSGRLNGKAIARTDLRKLGETSLHTFKKKIDYSQSMAITRHGVLGIKVWVSYSLHGETGEGQKKAQVK